jgi:hypothetical protein
MRKYVQNGTGMMSLENAKHDELLHSRIEYVSEIMRVQPKFKHSDCPYHDKRKTTFKGMTALDGGDKFQGTWVVKEDGEEAIHGKGIYIYANGSQFVGWFHEGEIIGSGRAIYYNGDIYQGNFTNQKYNGHGKYTFGESHAIVGYYEGEFKDDKITGEGTFQIKSKKPLTEIFGKIKLE